MTCKLFSSHFIRRGAQISALLALGFIIGCAKEEAPPAQAEKLKPSLVDQYKDTSKSTAENPGVAGAPKEMKEEEKKPTDH